jgi:small-conductance mechanosensitive channel
MALGEFGFDLGPLIASAGIVGAALGLGHKPCARRFVWNLYVD